MHAVAAALLLVTLAAPNAGAVCGVFDCYTHAIQYGTDMTSLTVGYTLGAFHDGVDHGLLVTGTGVTTTLCAYASALRADAGGAAGCAWNGSLALKDATWVYALGEKDDAFAYGVAAKDRTVGLALALLA